MVRGGGSLPANWAAGGAARLSGCHGPYYRAAAAAARLNAAEKRKVVFRDRGGARAAMCKPVQAAEGRVLHRSSSLHHSAGGLQCTDDQSNAKVTAMQLLLSREVRGTENFVCGCVPIPH